MARRVAPLLSAATGESPRDSAGGNLVDLATPEAAAILLVDDRPENLRALEAVLEPLGVPLETAGSGRQALRLLLERDYALILLDVRMPGMDGLETARLIKGRAATRDIPIVFLTAARDEVSDMLRGYGIGAIDYVLKPFDPELLRSKVAVFVELETSRQALQRSEALLRGAFEAAPIGKTVLEPDEGRIIRSNPAFARLLRRTVGELLDVRVADLCHPDDREALAAALDRATANGGAPAGPGEGVDLRLKLSLEANVWVTAVASSIDPTDYGQSLLLVQWVDLSARRRAEQARAELLLAQAAQTQAEQIAERLEKLQTLAAALEALSLDELLPELAGRLGAWFGAQMAEVHVDVGLKEPIVVRAAGGRLLHEGQDSDLGSAVGWLEEPMQIERSRIGVLRLALPPGRELDSSEQSLLAQAADRAALSIRRAQLHQEEHRIAVELQRGLLPKELPVLDGIELAARYEAAGVSAQVGGDWYDTFLLTEGRLGVIVGDVAGRGIPAATAMGQLRSLTRGFAFGDDQTRSPGEVLTRLNRHQLALASEEMFTVLYAIIDPRSATVTWANAGHPPPLRRSGSGKLDYLEGGDGLIGIEDVAYRTLTEPVGRGGALVLYTDGLIERRGESLDVGLERLAQATVSGPEKPAELCDLLLERLVRADEQLQDDVTAFVVRFS